MNPPVVHDEEKRVGLCETLCDVTLARARALDEELFDDVRAIDNARKAGSLPALRRAAQLREAP